MEVRETVAKIETFKWEYLLVSGIYFQLTSLHRMHLHIAIHVILVLCTEDGPKTRSLPHIP